MNAESSPSASRPPAEDAGASGGRPATGDISSTYMLGGQRLRVEAHAGRCQLTYGTDESALPLDLAAPCYLLLWNQPPPRLASGRTESGGAPVGALGDPMAWQYPSASNATVIAIIGDPVSEELKQGSLYKARVAQKLHCAGSLQAVKWTAGTASLGPKRAQSAVYCAEIGIDEKDFWMLAHD